MTGKNHRAAVAEAAMLAGGMLAALALAACAGDGAQSHQGFGTDGEGNSVGFGGVQDIGEFRDILDRGEIPGPETLDANGFFSEHFSELPPSDCGEPICLHAMTAVSRDWVRWEPQSVVQVALSSSISGDAIEAVPIDFALVVDTSGSMSGDRISYLKQGLAQFGEELGADDRVALIEYKNTARQVLPLGPVDGDYFGAVTGLEASGNTNISHGLELGFAALADSNAAGRQQRIILLSDGLANEGITSTREMVDYARPYVLDGVSISTIGVGSDFNREMMQGLAVDGGGNFYFLEDPRAVTEVFTEELDYYSVPIAFDLEIDVEGRNGYAVKDIVGSARGSEAITSGRRITIPSLFLSTRRSDSSEGEGGRRGGGGALFVELEMPSSWREAGDAAQLRARYTTPAGERLEGVLVVSRPGIDDALDYYSSEFMREHYAMYNMYRGLFEAASVAAFGDYECAHEVLLAVWENAIAWNAEMQDPDISADLELVGQFLDNLENRGVQSQLAGNRASCAGGGDWNDDEYYADDVGYQHRHCSAGSGASGVAAIFIAMMVVAMRRRRSSVTMRR